MKTLIIFLAVIGFHRGLGQGTQITIELKNPQSDIYYVGYHLGDQRYVLDTLTISPAGVLEISDSEGLKSGLYFLYSDQSRFYQEFFVNEPSFTLKSGGDYATTEVIGSKENEVFKTYRLASLKLQAAQQAYADSLKSLSGDDSLAVIDKLREMSDDLKVVRQQIYDENPDLLVSKMLNLLNRVPVLASSTTYVVRRGSTPPKRQGEISQPLRQLDT